MYVEQVIHIMSTAPNTSIDTVATTVFLTIALIPIMIILVALTPKIIEESQKLVAGAGGR